MDKDRAKKLDTVFSQIEKQFGEGSLMKLGAEQVKKYQQFQREHYQLI